MGKNIQVQDIKFEDNQLIFPIESEPVACSVQKVRRPKTKTVWEGYEAKTILEKRDWDNIEIIELDTVKFELGREEYIATYKTPDQL